MELSLVETRTRSPAKRPRGLDPIESRMFPRLINSSLPPPPRNLIFEMDVSYKSNRSNSEIQVYARYLSSFQRIEIERLFEWSTNFEKKVTFFFPLFFFFNAPFPQSWMPLNLSRFFFSFILDRSIDLGHDRPLSCSHNSSWDCLVVATGCADFSTPREIISRRGNEIRCFRPWYVV